MVNNIKAFAKFIDQPIMISQFNRAMPRVLTGAGTLFWAVDTYDSFKKEGNKRKKKKEAFKKAVVIGTTIASAIAAPKVASKITKRPLMNSVMQVRKSNITTIDEFLKTSKESEQVNEILKKAKREPISFKNIKILMRKLKDKEIFNTLIPEPENITSKEIFSEIGYLSVFGAVPVVGGLAGGIAADAITRDKIKQNIPNKINEGIYQYLANIFSTVQLF